MSAQVMISLLIGVFIVYRLYRRVRRTFGWQTLNLAKMRIFTVILSVLGLVFLAEGFLHPVSLISDLIGIALGFALAYYAAGLTRFERRGAQWAYLSNPWIGGLVTVLFFGRLAYRVFDMVQYGFSQNMSVQLQHMAGSWTSGLMLIMFAYYIAFNMLLLGKQKRLSPA